MLGHDDGSERKVRSRAGKGKGKGKCKNRVHVRLTGIDMDLRNICTFLGSTCKLPSLQVFVSTVCRGPADEVPRGYMSFLGVQVIYL